MSRKASKHRPEKRSSPPADPARPSEDLKPVDEIDGIPDRTAGPRIVWVVALLAIFLAWLAFLIYAAVAGRT